MRRFSANYIFPVNGLPIKNGIIELDSNNTIVNVIDPAGEAKEYSSMEFHNGVIVPGFVNAHCHIELSHLKGRLDQNQGIAGFVSQIRNLRNVESSIVQDSIKQAISTLYLNGTVAVGDICNTTDTLSEKAKSNIYFYNFIELFGLNSSDAREKIDSSLNLLNSFQSASSGSSSLTPHSTYSISDKLWNLIAFELDKNPSLVSIHYGESDQEYSLLKNLNGILADNFKMLGIPINLPDCKSPLEVVKRFIPKNAKTLFVHNTFSTENEVRELISHFDNPSFVLCPASNLFIEGRLPNIPMLVEQGAYLALGTDSYASSNSLSVFDQMQILLEHFPTISFSEILKWGTINGARALNIESKIGSFEKSKHPGLNLITNFDFGSMKPTRDSRVRRLV